MATTSNLNERGNNIMRKQIEVIGKAPIEGYSIYEIINEDGHEDVISLIGLGDLIAQGYEISIEEDEAGNVVNPDLADIDASYMEVVSEDDIVDVYFHQVAISNGMVKYESGGEYVKSYKSEKAAVNYASKQNLNGAIVIN